jgi:hypothetical protein
MSKELEDKIEKLEARVEELETAWKTGKIKATDENIEKGLLFNDPKYLEPVGLAIGEALRKALK